jgi:hypothetical protein
VPAVCEGVQIMECKEAGEGRYVCDAIVVFSTASPERRAETRTQFIVFRTKKGWVANDAPNRSLRP